MEDELAEKQAFLRENILEKGYDAEDFMKYLQSKKKQYNFQIKTVKLNGDENIAFIFKFTEISIKKNARNHIYC